MIGPSTGPSLTIYGGIVSGKCSDPPLVVKVALSRQPALQLLSLVQHFDSTLADGDAHPSF
jgi:hypothetical protein